MRLKFYNFFSYKAFHFILIFPVINIKRPNNSIVYAFHDATVIWVKFNQMEGSYLNPFIDKKRTNN